MNLRGFHPIPCGRLNPRRAASFVHVNSMMLVTLNTCISSYKVFGVSCCFAITWHHIGSLSRMRRSCGMSLESSLRRLIHQKAYQKRVSFGPHCLKRHMTMPSVSETDRCKICERCVKYAEERDRNLDFREHSAFDSRMKRGSTVLLDFEGLFTNSFKNENITPTLSDEKAFSFLAPSILRTQQDSKLSRQELLSTSAGRLYLLLNTVEQKLQPLLLLSDNSYYDLKQFENFLLLCGFHWVPREYVPTLYASLDTNNSGNLHVSEILFVTRKAHALARKILSKQICDLDSLANNIIANNPNAPPPFLSYQLSRLYSNASLFFSFHVFFQFHFTNGGDCRVSSSIDPEIILSFIDVHRSESERAHSVSHILHDGSSNCPSRAFHSRHTTNVLCCCVVPARHLLV